MKMKTRMIALVLLLALTCAMLPQVALTAHAAANSGSCGAEGDNLTWTLDIDLGVLTIEGSGKMADYNWNGSPWYEERQMIETVILPEGLTSVGASAFDDCENLTDVTIPNTVTEIGERAFYQTGLSALTIPDCVTKIGEYAFAFCGNLLSVTIPASVTEIGDAAFTDCYSMTAIHVAADNPSYCDLDGVLFDKERTVLLQYPVEKPGSVYEIPEGVKTTAERAFMQNSHLETVTVPSSMENLGDEPFLICYKLVEIQVASENESYSSFDGVLFDKDGTTLLRYPRARADVSYAVPDGVQCINSSAFLGCEYLQNVTIPNGVTTIESWAFIWCDSLKDVTLPDSIVSIGMEAFEGTAYFEDENNWDGRLLYLGQWLLAARSEILTASIREGTFGIAGDAFCDCVSVKAVSIPDSVKKIEEGAFANCSSLEAVTMGNGVTEIGESAFWGCDSLKSLTLPDSLTSIGDRVFCYCAALESIVIPEGVTDIPSEAFRECTSLKRVTLPNRVTKIDYEAFGHCASLQSVSIPESVTEIENFSFYECKALEEVTIPEGVTRVGYCAFDSCPKLTSVEIPASVTEIGDSAFGYGWDDEQGVDYKTKSFTIYGDKDTAAQRYAKENRFNFVLRSKSNPFADVQKSDFFFNPVMWALGNDVTGGTDETHFSPNQTVQRCDSMVFFWAAKGRPDHWMDENPFKDVKKKHWYYDAVMWAVENSITAGTDATHFSPNKTCSRSEILQFLYAAMNRPDYSISNPYSDVKPKHWYYDGAIWAYERGLEHGENGKFNAMTPCTRGYVVTYLYRYLTGLELAQ